MELSAAGVGRSAEGGGWWAGLEGVPKVKVFCGSVDGRTKKSGVELSTCLAVDTCREVTEPSVGEAVFIGEVVSVGEAVFVVEVVSVGEVVFVGEAV